MDITAKQLRSHGRLLLAAVDKGEEVIITYRGQPRARVVPVDGQGDGEDVETELFGLWADYEGLDDPAGHVRVLRQARKF